MNYKSLPGVLKYWDKGSSRKDRFQMFPFSFRCVFKSIHFGLRIQMFVFSWSFLLFPCKQEVKPQWYLCVFKWKHITGAKDREPMILVAYTLPHLSASILTKESTQERRKGCSKERTIWLSGRLENFCKKKSLPSKASEKIIQLTRD